MLQQHVRCCANGRRRFHRAPVPEWRWRDERVPPGFDQRFPWAPPTVIRRCGRKHDRIPDACLTLCRPRPALRLPTWAKVHCIQASRFPCAPFTRE